MGCHSLGYLEVDSANPIFASRDGVLFNKELMVDANSLSLEFHATSRGIEYRVETSEDLVEWTTEGLVISPPSPDQRSAAMVARGSSARFLRLVVREERPNPGAWGVR